VKSINRGEIHLLKHMVRRLVEYLWEDRKKDGLNVRFFDLSILFMDDYGFCKNCNFFTT
jgi:hypothetical protein